MDIWDGLSDSREELGIQRAPDRTDWVEVIKQIQLTQEEINAINIVADYLQASKETNQNNFNTNDDVIFDTIDRVSGSSISLNTTTGVFTLEAGKTYKLSAGIRFEHSSAVEMGFSWYNITNSIIISVPTRSATPSEGGHYSSLPVTQTILIPSVTTEVTFRCTWDGDGVEDVNAGYTWAIVEVMK